MRTMKKELEEEYARYREIYLRKKQEEANKVYSMPQHELQNLRESLKLKLD